MNDYTGKICPFCKTEFKPNDDIVVCSECDMPHHKDCWVENQGCTTFGCLGTIQAADHTATSVTTNQMSYDDANISNATGTVYCTKCGSPNSTSASVCSKCGNRFTTTVEHTPQAPVYAQANPAHTTPYAYVGQQSSSYQPQTNDSYGGYNNSYQSYQTPGIDADIQRLIGVKSEYYVPEFLELKLQNKKTSWNWPAFLVSPYWFMYRKMYGYGAGTLGVAFIIALPGFTFLSLAAFGGYIAIGIFANYIYMNFLEHKAQQAKGMTEPYKTQFIAQNSGVNSTATVLTVIGYALLVVILSV